MNQDQFQPDAPTDDTGPRLCEADCAALDALVDAGFDCNRLDGQTRQRAESMLAALGALDAYPVEESDVDLVASTLQRIEQSNQPMPIESWRLRRTDWRSGLAAAAAVLIIASVVVPMMSNTRSIQMNTRCLANMSQAGTAFDMYAQSNDGALPVRFDTAPDGNWLASRANSANLFHLAKSGFAAFADLACPGNEAAPDDAVLANLDNWPSVEATSFSYQHMLDRPAPARWDQQMSSIILADRSPVVDAAYRGETYSRDANSNLHNGRGQNVLMSDGSGRWFDVAWYGRDNLWLPESCNNEAMFMFTGTEGPETPYDVMLTH